MKMRGKESVNSPTIRSSWRGLVFSLLCIVWVAPAAFAAEKLPEGLKWLSNNDDPVFASPKAKKGGTLYTYFSTQAFPLTLRIVGPDSNGSFANQLLYSGQLPLVTRHPNTGKTIPALAKEWAYGADGRSMYFKIDPSAKWSDGKPFTADDVVFTLKMLRMKEIRDPFRNSQAEKEYEKVVKFDTHTVAIFTHEPKTNLDHWIGQQFYPMMARHFFEGKVDKNFVKKFNWKPMPGTGPYQVGKVQKGKRITMTRVKNWWGEKNRYFKNRFNADVINYKLYRDEEVAFEAFMKGDVDHAWLTRPVWWHDKAKGEIFDKGYAHKYWMYNERETGPYGMFLNLDLPLFKDVNVRHAFGYAINVDLVTEKLIYGDYERMNQFFEGYGPYTQTGIKAREFSVEKVAELMKKSGWKRGSGGIWQKGNQRFSVSVNVGKSPQIEKRLEVMREEAKKAGLDLKISPKDSAAAFKAAREKKFEVYYGAQTSEVIPEPRQYLHSEFAIPNSNNFSNINDKKLDGLIEKFVRATNPEEEAEAMRSVLKRVHEIGSFVGLWVVPFDRVAVWRWIRFPTPPGNKRSDQVMNVPNHYQHGGLFWIDDAVKKETRAAMKSGKAFKPVTIIDKTYKAQ